MQLGERRTLYISVGSAVLAVLLMGAYISANKRQLLMWSDPVAVVVASRDILENVMIDELMVQETVVPKRFAQPGAVQRLSDAVGRATIAPVRKGEQLTGTKVVEPGRSFGLTAKVPRGKRAVTLAINEVSGVAGLIKPDNHVDILTTFDFGNDTSSKTYTYTIIEDVKVLAVGDELGSGYVLKERKIKEEKGLFGEKQGLAADQLKRMTVTVALTPADAQKVVLAQETGSISLSLRPQWEPDQELSLEPATPANITGMGELLRSRSRPAYKEYRGK